MSGQIHSFFASVQKEVRMILRDRIGLALMFLMPVVLVVIIASVQNSTFEMVNNNRMDLWVCNQDSGRLSGELIRQLDQSGMYRISVSEHMPALRDIRDSMRARDVLVLLVVPPAYSADTRQRARFSATRTLARIGMGGDTAATANPPSPGMKLYYMPVLQDAFRQTITGNLRGALNMVERKENIFALYHFMDSTDRLATQEASGLNDQSDILEVPVLKDGRMDIPSATQHNVPAWTIFAMFFIVISLGGNLVREKNNGSFIRMKTMPTPWMLTLLAKQFTYLAVTLLQAILIFSIGIWLFPQLGLPALNLPPDLIGLVLVTILCGVCAVSYATVVGMYTRTPEQTNGFGAVSIVIFAAIGGIMVPSFVMSGKIRAMMNLSPLHWCLEAYYGLFLEGEVMSGFLAYAGPLLVIIVLLQALIIVKLRRSGLI